MPEAGDGAFGLQLEALEAPTSPVRLRRVPLPLNGNERYQWRMMSVLVALNACRGKSATVEQLHTLVWAINDPINAGQFEVAWNGGNQLIVLRGYVSGMLDTLKVAQVEQLIEQASTGRQKLTAKGSQFVQSFREDGGTLGVGDDAVTSRAPITSTDLWRRLGENV